MTKVSQKKTKKVRVSDAISCHQLKQQYLAGIMAGRTVQRGIIYITLMLLQCIIILSQHNDRFHFHNI